MKTKSSSRTVHSIPRNDRSGNPLLDTSSYRSSTTQYENGSKINYDDEERAHLTSCGIGSWRPEWMQLFASPGFFMINMALIGVIQGMTGTMFFSSISTFEKRYAFDSKASFLPFL